MGKIPYAESGPNPYEQADWDSAGEEEWEGSAEPAEDYDGNEERERQEIAAAIGPMTTDRGVLLVAFALLRKEGYWTPAGQRGLAATYWQDCSSCALAALMVDAPQMADDPTARRYVFWAQQDDERAFDSSYADLKDQLTHSLYIAWDGDGAFIVAQLEFAIALCGAIDRLRVVWDGDVRTRIIIERYVPLQPAES